MDLHQTRQENVPTTASAERCAAAGSAFSCKGAPQSQTDIASQMANSRPEEGHPMVPVGRHQGEIHHYDRRDVLAIRSMFTNTVGQKTAPMFECFGKVGMV